ncbi:uncharacterized protein DS421_4g126760 [Arachis hypogaea]|nr:uncharacterized protein DS421_4g126760 [Arachis hypogaea]
MFTTGIKHCVILSKVDTLIYRYSNDSRKASLTHSHLSISLTHSPRRLLCLVPTPPVFVRLCHLRLCLSGRLFVSCLTCSASALCSSASAASAVIVLAPLQALLCSSWKLCPLSPVVCSATAQPAPTPSWKTVTDSVSASAVGSENRTGPAGSTGLTANRQYKRSSPPLITV